jgi:uncharacterized coiled-coil protein SlyX
MSKNKKLEELDAFQKSVIASISSAKAASHLEAAQTSRHQPPSHTSP